MNNDLLAIKAALADRCQESALYFLGEPSRRGKREWRWGKKSSVSLIVSGPKQGLFSNYEADISGSGLDLIMDAQGYSFADAVLIAKEFLGWSDDERPRPTRRKTKLKPVEIDLEEMGRIEAARVTWKASKPIQGTPGEKYLNGRGLTDCTIARYADVAAAQKAFHWWRWGAVVFPVTDGKGTVKAVQLIAVDGSGKPVKHWENDGKIKITRGALHCAAIRFPGDGPLILAEGPETAASCSMATGWETWSAVGNVTRADLSTVPLFRKIIVAADDDAWNAPSLKSLRDAIKRWRGEGRTVLVAKPWDLTRRDKSDFNDLLQAEGVKTVRERLQAPLATPGLKITAKPILAARTELTRALNASVDRLLAWNGAFEAVLDPATGSASVVAPFEAVKVTTGVGKTEVLIARAVREAAKGKKIVYLVPTHKLGKELVQRIHNEVKKQGVPVRIEPSCG